MLGRSCRVDVNSESQQSCKINPWPLTLIVPPWPAQGKPHRIHVDNGSDFRSRVFQAACTEWGIELTFRPPGSPHFGGHIERLIGTMMGAVQWPPKGAHRVAVARDAVLDGRLTVPNRKRTA